MLLLLVFANRLVFGSVVVLANDLRLGRHLLLVDMVLVNLLLVDGCGLVLFLIGSVEWVVHCVVEILLKVFQVPLQPLQLADVCLSYLVIVKLVILIGFVIFIQNLRLLELKVLSFCKLV